MTKVFIYHVQLSDAGFNLLDFLSKRFTYKTRDLWEQDISNQIVQVNGSTVSDTYLLKARDEVQYYHENYIEPEVDKTIKILYESEHLLAVQKSGNLPTHPAGRYKQNTLLSILENDYQYSNLYVLHRLDRETSGVQLFAKNSKAASLIQREFELQNIFKEYIVYVHGKFPIRVEAKGYLSRDLSSNVRKKNKFSYQNLLNGVECETEFTLLLNLNGHSKLLAYPKTGKTHQIRATLYSLGFPIYGDKMYGTNENYFLQFIQTGKLEGFPGRQALHAHRLRIPKTILFPEIEIIAEEPEDLKEVEKNFYL